MGSTIRLVSFNNVWAQILRNDIFKHHVAWCRHVTKPHDFDNECGTRCLDTLRSICNIFLEKWQNLCFSVCIAFQCNDIAFTIEAIKPKLRPSHLHVHWPCFELTDELLNVCWKDISWKNNNTTSDALHNKLPGHRLLTRINFNPNADKWL